MELHDTAYNFRLIDRDHPRSIQSVERFDYYHIITRTYSFDGFSFELTEESTFPQNAADIPPQYHLGYDSDHDWHVYRCDAQNDTSDFYSRRICGMTTDGSHQRVIISKLASSILVSQDGQWLVFAASPEGFSPYDCQSNLYKMPLAGKPLSLVSSNELRICYIPSLEWLSEGDKTWVQFHNWDSFPLTGAGNVGSSHYRVDFEDGTLKQN